MGNKNKAKSEDKKVTLPKYKIKEGRSIACKIGVVDAGGQITAKHLANGDKDIEHLLKLDVIEAV